ncbi:hypothetical protein J3Q64DRAFT_1703537 [Phycomyces blakesleeanus]|uniref:Uncharacterized protein n=1 Tax=Phycomyces blakesleeanus TaxID=4837 RepID=A0ABR3AK86_PHYBL
MKTIRQSNRVTMSYFASTNICVGDIHFYFCLTLLIFRLSETIIVIALFKHIIFSRDSQQNKSQFFFRIRVIIFYSDSNIRFILIFYQPAHYTKSRRPSNRSMIQTPKKF